MPCLFHLLYIPSISIVIKLKIPNIGDKQQKTNIGSTTMSGITDIYKIYGTYVVSYIINDICRSIHV